MLIGRNAEGVHGQRKVGNSCASTYNVRKLHFQARLCEAFAEDRKQHDCGDLVLGWAVLQKTVFNHQ